MNGEREGAPFIPSIRFHSFNKWMGKNGTEVRRMNGMAWHEMDEWILMMALNCMMSTSMAQHQL